MSHSRSASLEIVPPASSNARDLAGVMDAMFKSNHKDNEDDVDDADADAEVDEIDEQAPAMKTTSSLWNPPNAPTPCERCVRTHKQCKGMAGARCEYCKRLKQKCSNSSGPARGKTSSAKKTADPTGTPKGTASKAAGPSVVTQSASHLKRKVPVKTGTPHNGDVDNHSLDGEGSIVDDDGHEPPPRLNKKRRISKGNGGPTRSQLVKAVADLEGSVKRIQASVAKEVEKITTVIKSLNAKIDDMDDD